MSFTSIQMAQLILALSLLVALHEGGHFLFAKLFHVKVEKFFLFFDPYFHLFSTKDKWFTRLFPKFKDKETAYGIGWIPLGGYVKIAGMIDESMDTEQMKQPVQEWEFRAKPAWQRLCIMLGGVLVNFLLALFIYAMILFAWGEDYISPRDMTQGLQFNEQAEKLGFRDGDILVAVDGREILKWEEGDIYRDLSEATEATVLRNGKEVTLSLPGDLNMLEMFKAQPRFLQVYVPAEIDTVMPGTSAANVGLQKGSRIVAVNGRHVETWSDYTTVLSALAATLDEGSTVADSMQVRHLAVSFTVPGEDAVHEDTVLLSSDLKMGVVQMHYLRYYRDKIQHKDYGFFASIPAGATYGMNVLAGYVNDMKYLFTSDGAKSVGSVFTIGSLFPPSWSWIAFWTMTAFLSVILAVMNILPIPGLDGGHAFFLLYEMIFRRQLSEKFMERAQIVGLCILGLLMVWALGNDITRFFL